MLPLQTGIEFRFDVFSARLSHYRPVLGMFDQPLKLKGQPIRIAFLG